MTVTINGIAPSTAQQRDFASAMGLPVLLQTVTIGSAQQDIDFTGLDLDAAVQYRIELIVAINAASIQDVFMYYNGDTTASNYQQQYVLGDAATASAARAASAFVSVGGTPSGTGQTLMSTIKCSKISGKSPIAYATSSYMAVANIVLNSVAHRWTGTANVTSIKLRHASNFGVGTVAKIYKD